MGVESVNVLFGVLDELLRGSTALSLKARGLLDGADNRPQYVHSVMERVDNVHEMAAALETARVVLL